ncbi:MAG TPA: GspH/FimT family protein [Paludibacteraceae bacterium]|nr:GspH/FimT family protein [Smithella sp.]HQF11475.1 GspH/FimT family protein [Paludibacteraceae bacterium]HQI24190.1 GspH/FimT family protein [Smithella sp.]
MKVKSTAKAFSLVELLIVIAIISIIGTIAVSSFAKYRGNSCLREAAREITGDIQLCKQKAVAENVRYRILLFTSCNNYTIQKETFHDNWVNVSSIKNIGEDDNAIKIIGDPTYPADKIIFQPRGTTNAGTLVLQHKENYSTASIVTSLMGRVRIKYDFK